VVVFREKISALLAALCKNGDQYGIVGTLPYLGTLPYTNTVRTYYNPANCASIPVYIRTEGGEVRTATSEDYLLLAARDSLGVPTGGHFPAGLSANEPLPAGLVLDSSEMALASTAIAAFNAAIREMAATQNNKGNHIAVVDLEQWFRTIAVQPQTIDGITVSSEYLKGDVFAPDGYTFTARGNALLANEFLRTLNETFDSNIPLLNVADYEGTVYP